MALHLLSEEDRLKGSSAAALGIFDGVHRGHRAVIDAAVKCSKDDQLLPVVCTFNTATVTTKGADFKPILTDTDKAALLCRAGAEYIYSPDFSLIRDMTAEEFAQRILKDKLNAGVIVCGRDFRFGRNAACGVEELERICAENKTELIVVGDVTEKGERVSSARIRQLLACGETERANELLGYDYPITGEVISGNRIGRTMDFPTANQRLNDKVVLPLFGVYASYCELDGRLCKGITNIGIRPTVEDREMPLAETHFPGFSGDIYGRTITVRLTRFVRPERKFSGVEELRQQIAADIAGVFK